MPTEWLHSVTSYSKQTTDLVWGQVIGKLISQCNKSDWKQTCIAGFVESNRGLVEAQFRCYGLVHLFLVVLATGEDITM